jgi:UDP-N-acetylglucosamine 4-epimerase
MLVAARDSRVRRFVYAASCATYGDRSAVSQIEENIGNPLSPYAVSKYVEKLLSCGDFKVDRSDDPQRNRFC